jgi:hypothetical protein
MIFKFGFIARLTWKFKIQNLNWIFNSTETKILTLLKIGLRNINKKNVYLVT